MAAKKTTKKPSNHYNGIIEHGGVILYKDEDRNKIEELLLNLTPEYKEALDERNYILDTLNLYEKDNKLAWKKFGEPGRSDKKYGEPDDNYSGSIEYAIINDEILVIRGEGDTFRVMSDKDQEESEENFWVLNSEIRKLRDKITAIVVKVTGEERMSIRARLFKNFKKLKTVVLGEGVNGVRTEAFAGCPIKAIFFPSTLEHIVEDSFIGAEFSWIFYPPLTSEKKNREFQSFSFGECQNLKYLVVPEELYHEGNVITIYETCENLDTDNRWFPKDGIGLIKVKGEYGLMRPDGTWIVEPKFLWLREFNEGLCPVQLKGDGKWGYIDQEGNWVIAPKYKNARGFNYGVAIVTDEDWDDVLIDKNGKIIGDHKFDSICDFHFGFAWAKSVGEKHGGIVNTQGMWAIEPNECFDDLFKEDDKKGVFDDWDYCEDWVTKLAEKLVIDENEGAEVKGLKAKQKGKKWGYVDKNDNWVIKPTFDSAEDFEEECSDCAIVKKGEKYGVIMKDGTFALKPQVKQAIRWYDFILVGEECEEKEIGVCGKCGILRSDGTWLFKYGDNNYDYIAQPHASVDFYLELWKDGDLCQLLFSDGTLKGDDY